MKIPLKPTLILDTITNSLRDWVLPKDKHPAKPMEREEVLGLKFQKGKVVKDRATGKTATVIAGTREIIPLRVARSKGS